MLSNPHQFVIIGGSDAGISAALRAHELAPDVVVTVVVADAFPNYSICGIPFYHSGEVPDWQHLAHRTRDDLEACNCCSIIGRSALTRQPTRCWLAI